MQKFKDFMMKYKSLFITLLALLITTLVAIDIIYCEENKPEEVTYDEFIKDLNSKSIDTIYYSNSEETMRYTLYNEETRNMSKEDREKYKYDKEYWRLTAYPAQENFREDMLKNGVNLVVKSFEPISINILVYLSSLIVPLLMFAFLIRMAYGNINGLKK